MPLDEIDLDRISDKLKIAVGEAMNNHRDTEHAPENAALSLRIKSLAHKQKWMLGIVSAIAAKLGIGSFFSQ